METKEEILASIEESLLRGLALFAQEKKKGTFTVEELRELMKERAKNISCYVYVTMQANAEERQ